jgi:hypothetical protein
MRYLLDSNVLLHVVNRATGHELIAQRLGKANANANTVCVSAIR